MRGSFFRTFWTAAVAVSFFGEAHEARADALTPGAPGTAPPALDASGGNDAAEPADPPRIDWGLRFNASIGAGDPGKPGSFGSGAAERVGVDFEYWLSKYFGVGMQFGLQALNGPQFLQFGCDQDCESADATVFSIAPSVSLRWGTPRSFGVVSMAAGYAGAVSHASEYCDSAYDGYPGFTCPTFDETSSGSGVYGSLALSWLFHTSGARAFAIGPMARLDAWSATGGWSATTGFEIGFGGSNY